MATGASTADVAIVLIDAKAFVKAGGLLPQSRRHTYIAGLLRMDVPRAIRATHTGSAIEHALGGFACVAIGFMLNNSAYYGEILRAGIESIPRGQVEAARSTGLSGAQTMAYVVLPQAVRNVLPDLLSNTLEVVKLTSLGSVVAVPELLYQARQAQSVTYNPTPIVMAAVIYFLILWPLVRVLSRLENRALAGRG